MSDQEEQNQPDSSVATTGDPDSTGPGRFHSQSEPPEFSPDYDLITYIEKDQRPSSTKKRKRGSQPAQGAA